MDIVFNDYSLEGQYSSTQEFLECLSKNIIPCLEIAKRKRIVLLKSFSTYSRKILPDKSLHDLLSEKGNVLLLKFKTQIVDLQFEPYWNIDSQNDNCLLEAASRQASLLSFIPSSYSKKTVAVKTSGGDEKEIVNSFDKGSFLEALSKFNVINLSNSFKIDGYPEYEYEIRSGEPRKHIPHFHVLVDKKYSASVGLEKFEILASDVSKKKWIEVFSEAISLIEKKQGRLHGHLVLLSQCVFAIVLSSCSLHKSPYQTDTQGIYMVPASRVVQVQSPCMYPKSHLDRQHRLQ